MQVQENYLWFKAISRSLVWHSNVLLNKAWIGVPLITPFLCGAQILVLLFSFHVMMSLWRSEMINKVLVIWSHIWALIFIWRPGSITLPFFWDKVTQFSKRLSVFQWKYLVSWYVRRNEYIRTNLIDSPMDPTICFHQNLGDAFNDLVVII